MNVTRENWTALVGSSSLAPSIHHFHLLNVPQPPSCWAGHLGHHGHSCIQVHGRANCSTQVSRFGFRLNRIDGNVQVSVTSSDMPDLTGPFEARSPFSPYTPPRTMDSECTVNHALSGNQSTPSKPLTKSTQGRTRAEFWVRELRRDTIPFKPV